MRADARRNRARILEPAEQVFAEQGVSALARTLEVIFTGLRPASPGGSASVATGRRGG